MKRETKRESDKVGMWGSSCHAIPVSGDISRCRSHPLILHRQLIQITFRFYGDMRSEFGSAVSSRVFCWSMGEPGVSSGDQYAANSFLLRCTHRKNPHMSAHTYLTQSRGRRKTAPWYTVAFATYMMDPGDSKATDNWLQVPLFHYGYWLGYNTGGYIFLNL